jgi:hypothetical protein
MLVKGSGCISVCVYFPVPMLIIRAINTTGKAARFSPPRFVVSSDGGVS